MDLHNIRQDYSKQELSPEQCASNPITQFEIWLQDAMHAQVPEPTAMNVASIDVDGRPSSRVVLLKEVNAEGFVFFSNYHSRKGQALAANPFAALNFFWAELERQVRVEGKVFRLPESCINIKGKTNEKLGYLGRMEAIEAQAIVLLEKK